MNSKSAVYHRCFVCLLAAVANHIFVIAPSHASELHSAYSQIRRIQLASTEALRRAEPQTRLFDDYEAELDRQRATRLAATDSRRRIEAPTRLFDQYEAELDRQQEEADAARRRPDARAGRDPWAKPPDGSRVQLASLPGDRAGAPSARPKGANEAPPVTRAQAQAQPATPSEGAAVEGEKRERPDVPLIVEKGGVLLRRGEVVVEPSVDFSVVETNRVEVAGFTVLPAILVGNFTISQVERETLTGALTGRVGVTDRLELEGRIPYVRRDDRETRRPIGTGAATEETVDLDGHGLGDIEFAGHYQINDGSPRVPFFVGNVRVKSDTGTSPFDVDTDASGNPTELPTGTGFWSVQPSITALLPSDPAVIFANVSYTWNAGRDVDGFGDIEPGDMFGGSLGLGFALNERLSMSMAYDHTYVLETTQNGVDTNSAFHIGRMLFGGSYRFSDRAAINLNFAVGVTEQAPDIQTELRVPVSFQTF